MSGWTGAELECVEPAAINSPIWVLTFEAASQNWFRDRSFDRLRWLSPDTVLTINRPNNLKVRRPALEVTGYQLPLSFLYLFASRSLSCSIKFRS